MESTVIMSRDEKDIYGCDCGEKGGGRDYFRK